MTVTGSGVFTDTASEATLRSKFDESGLTNFQFLVPNFGTFTGNFRLTTLEYGGEFNGEVTYSFTFESSGTITFATVYDVLGTRVEIEVGGKTFSSHVMIDEATVFNIPPLLD